MGDEQLAALIKRARAVVEEAGVSEDLRQVAFTKAFDLLSTESSTVGSGRADHESSGPDQTELAKIARRLSTDEQTAGEVFDANDDLQLVFARSRLPLEKGPAMRIIALLTATGRQAGGYDPDWTTGDSIREQCRRFGVLDGRNFASSLSGVRGWFVVRGGPQQKEYKVTRAGFEEAARLVGRLGAGERL
jgi:hypothetical protein